MISAHSFVQWSMPDKCTIVLCDVFNQFPFTSGTALVRTSEGNELNIQIAEIQT